MQTDPGTFAQPFIQLDILGPFFQGNNPEVVVMFQFVDIPAPPGGMETSGGLRL
jgi:hypothetical protein